MAGLTWGGAEVSLHGRSRAVLVARQTSSLGPFARARFRLVYALGRSDGSFDSPHRLAEGVSATFVSAVNPAGAGLIAWADARTGATWLSERAAFTQGGRVVLAWAAADVREGRPIRIGAGVALRDAAGAPWRAYRLAGSTVPSGRLAAGTPAVPIIDRAGRTFVAFTGVSGGASVVEVARITAAGPRGSSVVSGSVSGAAVEDAAAGPRASVVVAWSAAGPAGATVVYASLRRGGGPFAPPERLTAAGAAGIAGSRAAFAPLTGQAVVTWSAVGADGRTVLRAGVSPPG